MTEKQEKLLKQIAKEVHFIYELCLAKQKKPKVKKEYASSKDLEEVFNFYKLYIKKDARISASSKETIKDFLKKFGKETLIAVMEKKSKSSWFMRENSWRGASWFFSNKKRFCRWIEESPEPPKLRPYYRRTGQPLSKDCRFVFNDYNANWVPFDGSKEDIKWINVDTGEEVKKEV